MKPSQACYDLIKEFEGLRLTPYACQAGVWTIGYGHTKNVQQGDYTITRKQAEACLIEDVAIFAKGVNSAIGFLSKCTQGQFDAMVSLAFNIGLANFNASTVLRKFREKDYQASADAFLMWNKVTDPKTGLKHESKGLTNRRIKEREVFLS